MNKNRCGAKGILKTIEGKVFFEVTELITEIEYGGRLKLVLKEDLAVGERIPLADLANNHRGIVVFDGVKVYLDEGELEYRPGIKEFVFVSDYDGPISEKRVSDLCILPYTFKIKPEIYDQLGAFRRLKQIKKAFRL